MKTLTLSTALLPGPATLTTRVPVPGIITNTIAMSTAAAAIAAHLTLPDCGRAKGSAAVLTAPGVVMRVAGMVAMRAGAGAGAGIGARPKGGRVVIRVGAAGGGGGAWLDRGGAGTGMDGRLSAGGGGGPEPAAGFGGGGGGLDPAAGSGGALGCKSARAVSSLARSKTVVFSSSSSQSMSIGPLAPALPAGTAGMAVAMGVGMRP